MLNAIVLIAVLLSQQPTPAQPETAIAGRVTYADGTPSARALLVAQPAGEATSGGNVTPIFALVGAEGNFRFKNIPPGRYLIRTGDSEAYYPGVSTAASATVLTVTAGSVTENLNFVLPAALTGYRVSGRVVRPPSQPQAATEVSGFSGTFRVSGSVAADGTFELLHVRAGIYSLEVFPAVGMRPVSVVVERDMRGLELAMPRLFDIAGTVTVEGRGGASGLFGDKGGPTLTLILDGPSPSVVKVQNDGAFNAAVPAAEYRIHADQVPADYYIKALTSGESDLLANRLQITEPEKPVQIALTLASSAGVAVSGKVKGLAGDASAARIALVGTVVNNTFDGPIHSDGSYALAKVMPGTYVARVTSNTSLASPPVSVVIPNRNIAGLEIAIPPPAMVSGRVTVDGSGPLPKFTLLLAPGSISNWSPTPGDETLSVLQQETRSGGAQVIRVDVDALPDGSFKFPLPAGVYRIAAPGNSIPSPYVLRSISYAGANILVDPLVISEKESSEIQVGFGTTSQNPWSRVSGRVIGMDSGRGPFHVALEGRKTSAMDAAVNADGTFEFARVLQNSTYTARLMPENDAASSPRVSVGFKDIDTVEITVPSQREIRVRTTVEGNGPLPSYVLTLKGSNSTVSALIKPDSSGFFQVKLPEDERQVSFDSLPLGYIVKSVMYGLTDLRACAQGAPPRCSYPPLKIAGSSATDLEVTFAVDPAIPFGKISGRVTGLSSEATDVRLVLRDAGTFSTFEQAIGAGGAFAFSNLPQGPYVPLLTGAPYGQSVLLSPSLINVNGIDTSGVVVAAPGGSSKQDRQPEVTDAPTGASVSEFGGMNLTDSREAAAVATLRTINTAEVTFLSVSRGNFGSMSQMIDEGLLPENYRGTVSGFNYGVISVGSDFVIAAIPNDAGSARYGFYVTPDGIVRYSTIESLAPAGHGGAPVH